MLTAAYSARPRGLPLYAKEESDSTTSTITTVCYCAPWPAIFLAVPVLLVTAVIMTRAMSLLADLRESRQQYTV